MPRRRKWLLLLQEMSIPFLLKRKGQLTGYNLGVLKEADELMDDHRFSFKKTSWESIFVGLDSGHYQVAANNISYTKERADKYLYSEPIATNPLVLVSPKNAKLKPLNFGGLTTQDDTGASTAKLVTDWNKKHKDNPSTMDYSGEDVSKRLLDLDNGEFDYLIFDKISVKTIIKQKDLDLYVTSIKSQDNPNNCIIFSDEQKTYRNPLIRLWKNFKSLAN